MKRNTALLVALLLALLAAACGGGQETAAPAESEAAEATAAEATAEEATQEEASDEQTAADGEVTPVTMALPVEPTLSIVNFKVAQDHGFWEDRGLDVELLFGQSGIENIGAVTTGQADITFLDLANLGNLIGEGETGLRVVMQWNPTNIFQVFALADSGIETPADLAGKKIGISGMGSVTRYILRGTLEEAGLTEEDVELVPVGATRVGALESGQIDALSAWDQIQAQVQYDGFETVDLPIGQGEILPSNLLTVTEETLNERPDFVRDFIEGLTEATLWAVEHPEEATETMREFLPAQFEDPEFGRQQLDLRLETFGNYDESQPYGYMDVDQFQEAAEFLAEVGAIPQTFDVSEYVTNDYLAEETGT
jgi:NitT/TauT family transport system substrate-binding protein